MHRDIEAAPAPHAVAELRSVVAEADAVLIATPEYNGAIPGQLKNASTGRPGRPAAPSWKASRSRR